MALSIVKARQFVNKDIWVIPPDKHSPPKYFLIRQLKIILIAIRGFTHDKIQLRASALTFYTLLSIVPIVAMLFGIASGFGFEKTLEKIIIEKFQNQKEVMDWIIKFAQNFLQNANGGVIAGFGVVLLFWSVMKVLGNIEQSFNDIWQIKVSRPLVRKFTDYLSIMLLAPVFFILSSSLTVYISTEIVEITHESMILRALGPVLYFLLNLIPYFLIWMVFTLIYVVMPNTKVVFKSAVIAGIIAGTMFQVLQWGYIHFQMGVNRYSAIYGGFAALPLFLIWLQISWLIVLLGAEISFANQNVENYEYEEESLHISQYYKRILSLYIARHVIRNFEKGDDPLTATKISHNLQIPIRIVREILYELVQTKIFSETVTPSPRERAYQPARDIHTLTVHLVTDALEKHGLQDLPVPESEELKKISEIQRSFMKVIKKSSSNTLLIEI
jgi:membrane protein